MQLILAGAQLRVQLVARLLVVARAVAVATLRSMARCTAIRGLVGVHRGCHDGAKGIPIKRVCVTTAAA